MRIDSRMYATIADPKSSKRTMETSLKTDNSHGYTTTPKDYSSETANSRKLVFIQERTNCDPIAKSSNFYVDVICWVARTKFDWIYYCRLKTEPRSRRLVKLVQYSLKFKITDQWLANR